MTELRRADDAYSHMLMVSPGGGHLSSLWTFPYEPGKLVALDARTLQVQHVVKLQHATTGGLGAAGGWIWVLTTADLEQVNPTTGQIRATVPQPDHRAAADLAANGSGTVLAELSSGSVLALLGPGTGKVIARYQGPPAAGGTVAGIADGQVLMLTSTGNMSTVERFDMKKRRFYPVYGWGYGPQIAVDGDRYVFEADPGFGARRGPSDYCGDTATGQPLAELPKAAALWSGRAIGYRNGVFYYLAADKRAVDLDEVALPGCR